MALKKVSFALSQAYTNQEYVNSSVELMDKKIRDALSTYAAIDYITWSCLGEALNNAGYETEEELNDENYYYLPSWEDVCTQVYSYGWNHSDNTLFLKDILSEEVELRPLSEYKDWL
jgi:hypothetical protein